MIASSGTPWGRPSSLKSHSICPFSARPVNRVPENGARNSHIQCPAVTSQHNETSCPFVSSGNVKRGFTITLGSAQLLPRRFSAASGVERVIVGDRRATTARGRRMQLPAPIRVPDTVNNNSTKNNNKNSSWAKRLRVHRLATQSTTSDGTRKR